MDIYPMEIIWNKFTKRLIATTTTENRKEKVKSLIFATKISFIVSTKNKYGMK